MVRRGIIAGYEDQTFRPNKQMTRAEFVAIVIRALGVETIEGKTFLDTENHWAKDDIATAHSLGIINGYDDHTFGADDPITREQMAAIIIAVFKLSSEKANHLTYKDAAQISPWAMEAIQTATDLGILVGYEDGTLRPKHSLTRAEAATVFKRVLDL